MHRCRICKSLRLRKIFSLGEQPLANSLLTTDKELTETYPLEWYQCGHCNLIQLGYVVNKRKMFDKYFYIPSVSKDHLKDFDQMAKKLVKELKLKKGSLVVDVGGSDGSFLECFQRRGMTVLNVEPAKNIKSKVNKWEGYFNRNAAEAIFKRHGRAKLITMTNVFAHVDNLQEVIKCLDFLLDDDGVFFARFPNVDNLLDKNQFDTIYHEHLSYFSKESLYHLFLNTPFEIDHIEDTQIHGGSMMLYVKRRENKMAEFVDNVQTIKDHLLIYLTNQKAKGKKIYGFGAAAKGTILLNYCGIDKKIIDYVIDDTPYKIGKWIPGVYIPIVSSKFLEKEKPDIILILAWNWEAEIRRKLKGQGYAFVIPIPKVRIIKNART